MLYAKSFQITDNIIYSGYFSILPFTTDYLETSILNRNTYFTKNSTPFLIGKKKYRFDKWKTISNKDSQSTHKPISEFQLPNILDITKIDTQENTYRVVLFNKENQNVIVDFSEYNLPSGTGYTIKDVEDFKTVLASGKLNEFSKVEFKMNVERDANKSYNNFGVYYIEFMGYEKTKTKSFFERFLNWLGI